MKRVKLVLVLIFVAAVSLNVVTIDKNNYKMALATSTPSKTVVLDAGHGGFDGGAVADDGTLEKDINLSITLKLKAFLKQGGFNVITIRETDTGIENDTSQTIAKRKVSDMKKRLEIINSNPDALFVSIHLNKFTTSSVKGAQVFYSNNREESETLAEAVQKSVKSLLQPENKRTIKSADRSIYLLKNAKIPAVIIECGFLSNQKELLLLKTDEYQKQMAFSIYCGILDYNNF